MLKCTSSIQSRSINTIQGFRNIPKKVGLCFKLLCYNSMECCSPPPEKSIHVQTDSNSGLLNIIYYRETKLNTIPHKRSYYSTLLLSTICLTIKIYLHCQSRVLSTKKLECHTDVSITFNN